MDTHGQMSTFIITAKDELIFKSLMIQAKLVAERILHLEENGIKIEDLDEVWGGIENCLLTIFEVPEDNTSTTMIRLDNGDIKYLPNFFCRDDVDDILWNYTSGEVSLDACFEEFKTYLQEVRDYLNEKTEKSAGPTCFDQDLNVCNKVDIGVGSSSILFSFSNPKNLSTFLKALISEGIEFNRNYNKFRVEVYGEIV
jgi:hypothetical protein